MTTKERIEVKVGQIWVDCDWRAKGKRKVKVIEIAIVGTGGSARVEVLTDRNGHKPNPNHSRRRFTTIRLDRFKPGSTGYRLSFDPIVEVKEDDKIAPNATPQQPEPMQQPSSEPIPTPPSMTAAAPNPDDL